MSIINPSKVSEDTPLEEGDKPVQLYSLATPNGQKVSILFEELGVKYDAHTIDIRKGYQFTNDFKKINPNSKIPAVKDKEDGLNLMESGHILLHYADKYKKFIPQDSKGRAECLNWLFWQMGGLGPMSGQFGHFFKYAPEKIDYGIERYKNECKRLVSVLESHLKDGKEYVCGSEYTIADMAIFPWLRTFEVFYKAQDTIPLSDYPNVKKYLDRCLQRPASSKGLNVCLFPE